MAWGEFPVGTAASLLRAGAKHCVGARYKLNAEFSATFFRSLARQLSIGTPLVDAFASTSEEHEQLGFDLWRDLACLEILGGP
jgi:hypothetical protein